jgi:small nuclear ribonucleoprotein (snRNP)-like protein
MGWEALAGQVVVVDTDSMFVYIGTLTEVDDQFVTLVNVDAHDVREAKSTKEQYVIDTKKYGVNPNRKEIKVRKAVVVSVSRLSDVVDY